MSSKNVKDKDIQVIIGNLLRYGIWSALFVSIAGGIIYLVRHNQEAVHYNSFKEKHHNLFQLIGTTLKVASRGNGPNIMTGILLLFLTPILRVVFSLIAFTLEKDYLYVVITLIVIIIIGLSIVFGFSH